MSKEETPREDISKEIKAKVFAQYLGQKVRVINYAPVYSLISVGLDGDAGIRSHDNIGAPCRIKVLELILKPLSLITDEHAIECLKIRKMDNIFSPIGGIENAKEAILEIHWPSTFLQAAMTTQYLQSKGYDIMNYHLNGQTLKEAGLAIYE